MAFEIPNAFVLQFSSQVAMLAEQKTSRLRRTVMTTSVTGESWAIDRLGGSNGPQQIVERHGNTPLNDIPNDRRWGYLQDWDVADLIDKPDQLRMLWDPQSRYTVRHAGAMGRAMDLTILNALGGPVAEGKYGNVASQVALPASQIIASGSTGLTVSKLLEAKRRLDAAEAYDPNAPRYFVCTSYQIQDLLSDDKVTSADFNTVKALAAGTIDSYMGFQFVRTELLTKSGTDRQCYAYTAQAIEMGIGKEPSSEASQRPDKRNATQIYTWGSWGAVRVEDVQVVQVLNTEPA